MLYFIKLLFLFFPSLQIFFLHKQTPSEIKIHEICLSLTKHYTGEETAEQEGVEKRSEKASPSRETATPLTVTRTIKETATI